MTPELIGLAVAIGGAYGIGRYVGTHRERQRAGRPKTIDQLAREQGIRPVRSIDDLPSTDPEVFNAEDLDSWDAAMKEARGW